MLVKMEYLLRAVIILLKVYFCQIKVRDQIMTVPASAAKCKWKSGIQSTTRDFFGIS